MKIRLTNGIWIGTAVGIAQGDIFKAMLTAATLEVMTIVAVSIYWFVNKYKEIIPGSFMSSIILPNTSPYKLDFAYQEVLFRIYIRAVALIELALWPAAWPILTCIFILTLVYHDK
jgi:hypothetical protein